MTTLEALQNRERCLEYLEGCKAMANPECLEAVRLSVIALREKLERENARKTAGGGAMKRMTKRVADTVTFAPRSNIKEELSMISNAIERLAAYEDTGLTPEEIVTMRNTLAEYQKETAPLPCKIGDEVYAIRYYKGQANVMKGIVGELFFTKDMKLMIVVKHICRGHWLETVFPTFETAALEVRKINNIKAGVCRKEET